MAGRGALSGLAVAPGGLAERLGILATGPAGQALEAAAGLLAETAALAVAHSGADIGAFREILGERRWPLDPPAG